ncbi:bifunctional diaminohydroxyphosphoribosylaminopyrimidine deaminase/5-amino-6-(5-phosphoribosylamino)uracil reductase RibD, partial [Nakamurella sp.]|uniref:bifunctional diaminohydroxyphosphoribosylaminopyrimidine deaminase/5-amino-6-(5-phosphoribosylamino)uracil reductase RibD n=1 Tax=Nakamurella sp. TaxID=1869182 RepID=UPI003B3A74A0
MTAVLTPAELAALHRAAVVAGRGAATALPNPVVGCVLLAPGGWTVGEGFHERPGGPHAEVVALRAAGPLARGATAVVTLEPCNHTGRTGPCAEALLAAGVARVLVAVRDPWPPAAGGLARLRAAGVDVVDLPALAATGPAADPAIPAAVAAAEDVNRVWLGAMRLGRPFVTWKVGMTLDGRVAAPDATSRWITSPPSRADVHALRARIDTILVGVGTVLADDPQLTVRDADGRPVGRQPLRVVLDSAGRTPAAARVRDEAAPTWIATAESPGAGADGRVDPAAVLAELWRRGRRHVLLEGGPRVAAAFLDAGLVDEVVALRAAGPLAR